MAQHKHSRSVGRPPGRPATGIDARSAIIEAACRHFAAQGIKATSNPVIARDAGVTPAMVHYYFRRREQLYEAVLDHLLSPLLDRLPAINSLEAWVETFHGFLMAHPWAPQLMAREVFIHNGQLRPLFLSHYGPKIFGCVRTLIAAHIGEDDPARVERHTILLQALLVFPFMGLEVGEELTGRNFDPPMLTAFRDDALQLFRAGIDSQT